MMQMLNSYSLVLEAQTAVTEVITGACDKAAMLREFLSTLMNFFGSLDVFQ